jgi:hypothetical protein
MAALLADENVADAVAAALLALGHDVITARAGGLAATPDLQVLTTATAVGRAVLTHDRDYIRLHKADPAHAGIVFATADTDSAALAVHIDAALAAAPALAGQLIRVYCPLTP